MTSSETPTMMLDRLADAAWEQLADLSPRAIHIDDIATDAGIPAAAARAVAGSISNLVLNKLARLDRQAVLETLAESEDAGDVPVRDKIIEGLCTGSRSMRRIAARWRIWKTQRVAIRLSACG